MLQVTHSLRIIVVLIFQDGQVIIIDLADLLRRRQGSRPGCFLQHPREVLQRPGGSAAGLTEHVNRSFGLETQGDQVLRFLGPHPLHQQQDAGPAHGVERVLDHPKVRQEILDVRRLDEFEPALFHERQIPP